MSQYNKSLIQVNLSELNLLEEKESNLKRIYEDKFDLYLNNTKIIESRICDLDNKKINIRKKFVANMIISLIATLMVSLICANILSSVLVHMGFAFNGVFLISTVINLVSWFSFFYKELILQYNINQKKAYSYEAEKTKLISKLNDYEGSMEQAKSDYLAISYQVQQKKEEIDDILYEDESEQNSYNNINNMKPLRRKLVR